MSSERRTQMPDWHKQERKIESGYAPFPNSDVILQEEACGGALLINFDTGHSLSLNAVGRFIWENADGDTSVEEITARIREAFSGVTESVAEETLEVVEVLKTGGFFGFEVAAGTKGPIRLTSNIPEVDHD